MSRKILAIDAGNIHSGYCILDYDTYKPLEIGKILNHDLLHIVEEKADYQDCVLEMIASYGMAVGQTVFDTCVWVGRYEQAAYLKALTSRMYRKDVKMNICGQTRAKDSNIRQALVDRFSYDRHKAKGGKGTKADEGFFFGFKADIWAAYAVGVTYIDQLKAEDDRLDELCLEIEEAER